MNKSGPTRRALIGYTGFVGSSLLAGGWFTDTFNSANFRALTGGRFDEVVCCGISAAKWLANKDPEGDWGAIKRLLDVIETISAQHFTLISTIDVYPDPAAGLDEGADLDGLANHDYGRHRLAVERWVAAHFPNHAIVRLPALFGRGLKKNVLFDLLTGNQIDKVNPATAFQWYPLERLPADLALLRAARLPLVNLFTEPLLTAEILNRFFPDARVGAATAPAVRYDTRTRYAEVFGGRNGHVADRRTVLDSMTRFVATFQGEAASG